MSSETKQRPVESLRDGAIKAAIWRNESENGAFFAVSFSDAELLPLALLAEKAYDRAGKLTRAARAADETEEEEGA